MCVCVCVCVHVCVRETQRKSMCTLVYETGKSNHKQTYCEEIGKLTQRDIDRIIDRCG